jgi:prepilin-type N-terminal cleavage/methylation domain-containing protein
MKKKRQRGYTLVEMVSVVVIVGASLAAILQMFELGLVSDKVVRWRTKAMDLAHAQMELEWATPYAEVASKSRADVPGFADYDVAVAVTTPQTNLKQIQVTVFWTGLSNTESSIAITSYRANLD